METTGRHEELIRQSVLDSAFKWSGNIIHLFEGGGALYGTSMGTSDLDIYGVFIEPKQYVFGLDKYEHFVSSTSDESRRNTAGDRDITLYSLRKWATLAAKGNPTALSFLFANNLIEEFDHSVLWTNALWKLQDIIVSKSAAKHFRGFVQGQMARLLGERGTGKHGQRSELIVDHGYDTKAAMHAVRLLGEGIELMHTGRIDYPRPNADFLKEIRTGEFGSLDKVCQLVSGTMEYLDQAVFESKLPEQPDRRKISFALTELYEDFYAAE